MLTDILSSKCQLKERVQLHKTVGEDSRQHQDPVQQSSCDTLKTLVEDETDGLKEAVADEESLVLGGSHVDQLNNNRGEHREDGAGAEDESVVYEESAGPADRQKETWHTVGLDNEVVEDFAGANSPSSNLKSPLADFVDVVATRSRTVDGDEVEGSDADLTFRHDSVSNQGNDILHLIGWMGKCSLFQ
ncbi:hypothetical protein HG531_004783 [Fusarium graminearum]|nr:hypothetical protein HG531_004783 [Fusarium graminearum]